MEKSSFTTLLSASHSSVSYTHLDVYKRQDYENEKEDFEVDEADTVELINGERMPREQVKRDGIDYIALYLSLIHI